MKVLGHELPPLLESELRGGRPTLGPDRLAALKPRLARSGLSNVYPVQIAHERDERIKRLAGKIDRVLVDAPCTGLGSLRRRPESRWRRTPADLPPLTRLQRELLVAALRAVRPGGVVAYVTCSPHIVETQVTVTEGARRSGVDVDFVDARPLLPPGMPKLGPGPTVQLWPHRHGTDAMFLAVLRRTA